MSERVYLDWNATAPLRAEARAAVVAALGLTGNASSVHAEGRAARRLIEAARAEVAALIGAEPKNVTFTSGATEANMLALTPAIEAAGEAASGTQGLSDGHRQECEEGRQDLSACLGFGPGTWEDLHSKR